MNYSELDEFQNEISLIEAFVTEVAAREAEIQDFGFRHIKEDTTFDVAAKAFRTFDQRLAGLLEYSRAVDRTLHHDISRLIEESHLADSLGKLFVSLKIAAERRPQYRGVLSLVLRAFNVGDLGARAKLFSQEVTSAESILVALHRLASLTKRVEQVFWRNYASDRDIFKPANIDREVVLTHIESAIEDIQRSPLGSEQKAKLIEHLVQARNDLAEDNVSWRKTM